MATVTIKFQNSLHWIIWFTSTSYQCWLNPLKTQAIFIIVAVLVIKRVQRVLPKLHANRAMIRTLTVTYGTLRKNKRSSVLNLPKQRQVCPSLFFQFNMLISVIYGTLSVSCKRVVRVLSPLASKSCGGSHLRPYVKAFPVFNVLETCREYFLTIGLGIVEFIKKFIGRFLEKCDIFRHGLNYVQKLYQKQLNAS